MVIQIIVAVGIGVLLVAVVFAIASLQRRGHNALSGALPIHRLAFLTAKASLAAAILTMLAHALGVPTGPEPPLAVQWLAVVVLATGLGFAIPSLFQLGEELRFGLSAEQTHQLKSEGLYRISRNPLYLGFYLIALAACLYAPGGITLGFTVLGIVLHHQIVLAEERFLHQQFGDAYDAYTRQVRRYL